LIHPRPFAGDLFKERDLARFDLADFLAKTGTSLNRLASYLRVAPSYLEAALEGTGRLTTRDQQACRLLWRRLFRAKQLDLPFAESPDTFSRSHARERARARATKANSRAATKPRRRARRGRHPNPQHSRSNLANPS
jgi:hypothetical protein